MITRDDDADQDLGTKVLFIGGCPRSGTTFLQLLLYSSDLIETRNETHLFSQYIGPLLRRYRTMMDKGRSGHRDVGLHLLVDEEELLERTRATATTLLRRMCREGQARPYICEKTPENMLWWREIKRVFPKAPIINVVRDPRSVVASTAKAARTWASEWAEGSALELAHRWNRYRAEAEELDASRSGVIIKYERLLARDVPYLRAKLSRLGIEVEREALRTAFLRTNIERLRSREPSAEWPWALHREPKGFFREARRDSWTHELTPQDRAAIEHTCAPYMRRFGYLGGDEPG